MAGGDAEAAAILTAAGAWVDAGVEKAGEITEDGATAEAGVMAGDAVLAPVTFEICSAFIK